MTGSPAGYASRESQQVDALITDRYIDTILAAHGRGADVGPLPIDRRPDAGIRSVVDWLARDLPRLHPSFRFEESLAAKLNDAALRMRRPGFAGGDPVPAPLADRVVNPDLAALAVTHPRPSGEARIEMGRPLLIGGAITSAAISLAGAVYVAWRIRHPQPSPMARAVRRVARTRLA